MSPVHRRSVHGRAPDPEDHLLLHRTLRSPISCAGLPYALAIERKP